MNTDWNKLILVYALAVIGVISIMSIEEAQARTSFVGSFEGTYDEKMINTVGEFRINNDIGIYVFVGTFENDGIDRFNPNCQKIVGDLVLEGTDRKITLDFTGKNCKYGLTSYVIGTFETNGGEGRITFVADHHNNTVEGQLTGVLNEIPEQINHEVVINDSIKLTGEKE